MMAYRILDRILVVEDDADIRGVVSLALISLGGYTVRVCASAAEALDAVRSFRPDLILLDVMMPSMDGPAALRALRQLDVSRDTPVVFTTARTGPEDMALYDELGCLGVVRKPFDPGALPEMLAEMWGRRLPQPPRSHQSEFEELRRAYIGELHEKIEAMQAAADAMATGGWDKDTVESLYRLAHRLAGSAGLYRLAALSRSAGALEEIVKRLLNTETWPPASSPVELATLVKAVGRRARSEARLTQPPRDLSESH
jgi:CheY-like chemotaxis protein